jgi:hypothetical protein
MKHIKYEERFVSLLDGLKKYGRTQIVDTYIHKL